MKRRKIEYPGLYLMLKRATYERDSALKTVARMRESLRRKTNEVERLKFYIKNLTTNLSPAKARAYRIADNKTAELSEWDIPALADELREIMADEDDLNALGFSGTELSDILSTDQDKKDHDIIPEKPGSTTIKVGDMFALGNHRVLCGDSTKPSNAMRVTGGKAVKLCVTDPPYDMPARAQALALLSASSDTFAVLGGGITWFELIAMPEFRFRFDFVLSFVGQVRQLTLSTLLRQHTRIGIMDLATEDEDQAHENGFVATSDSSGFKFSGKTFRDRMGSMCSIIDLGAQDRKKHSHQKPVRLWRALIAAFPGNDIWEPFAGSGAMLIAGELEQKTIYTMELDPLVCAQAIERWEKFTGNKAIKIS